MSLLGEYPGQDGHLHDMELMCHPIVEHGLHHRIAEDDLAIVSHSGVVVEDGLHIGEQQPFDFV